MLAFLYYIPSELINAESERVNASSKTGDANHNAFRRYRDITSEEAANYKRYSTSINNFNCDKFPSSKDI